ncbi:peptide ABC transporter ATP-binding protein [Enterocloster clostridioformis]|uniref:ABC transporter ATP-binding protein n=1 Tax=Enterocloster clostridioformis TaxID=1531 RepID=UPI0009C25537|nr:ABC transporter ATP-binding protein [Enterocloster clostridioformis]ANU50430.2 peptide ABC transporter ATP-binding protein [Lachnoclostridium sp. YL32]NDO30044.1 ABC transporter ATP-binding protein [Enterocloster clostridioformis]OXE67412.1 peptide ABC transporter ATP-binding protein [Enterocloster clostridioformis]QQQ99160.1 ABC transporter ATP-binding protein [Enterocloster clostridioformis]
MKPDETQNRMQSEMTNEAGTLLEIRNLKVRFTARKKVLTAVDGVSMSIRPCEIVGVVGESGSGKSVMSQSILRLREYDSDVRYEGQVLFEGQDLLKASQAEMRGIRGNRIAVIFQDPMTSLSPVHTVGRQLSEVLVLHKKMTKQRAKERCRELLRLTGIPNPEDCMRKYPYELSGGMQQRVMIAMALSCEPKLLIADEPTTALDVTIQEQILNLIAELNERMGMSVLFITHDLGAMAQLCHSVRVMYLGNLVEEARTEELFARPMHPYTQGLLDCIPRLDSDRSQQLHVISGVVPPLSNVPGGCRFCTRCPYADQRCMSQNPPSVEVFPEHKAKCWKYTPEQEAE